MMQSNDVRNKQILRRFYYFSILQFSVFISVAYLCMECGMGFQRPWELKSHEARHKSLKTVTCKECGAQFYNNSELRSHARMHSDERR